VYIYFSKWMQYTDCKY